TRPPSDLRDRLAGRAPGARTGARRGRGLHPAALQGCAGTAHARARPGQRGSHRAQAGGGPRRDGPPRRVRLRDRQPGVRDRGRGDVRDLPGQQAAAVAAAAAPRAPHPGPAKPLIRKQVLRIAARGQYNSRSPAQHGRPRAAGSPMARITVEDCLEVVDNRFELVMMAAKRARQLANGVEPQLDNSEANDKPTVLALREIAARRIDEAYIEAVDKAERERKEREALEWAAAEVVADDDLSKGDD